MGAGLGPLVAQPVPLTVFSPFALPSDYYNGYQQPLSYVETPERPRAPAPAPSEEATFEPVAVPYNPDKEPPPSVSEEDLDRFVAAVEKRHALRTTTIDGRVGVYRAADSLVTRVAPVADRANRHLWVDSIAEIFDVIHSAVERGQLRDALVKAWHGSTKWRLRFPDYAALDGKTLLDITQVRLVELANPSTLDAVIKHLDVVHSTHFKLLRAEHQDHLLASAKDGLGYNLENVVYNFKSVYDGVCAIGTSILLEMGVFPGPAIGAEGRPASGLGSWVPGDQLDVGAGLEGLHNALFAVVEDLTQQMATQMIELEKTLPGNAGLMRISALRRSQLDTLFDLIRFVDADLAKATLATGVQLPGVRPLPEHRQVRRVMEQERGYTKELDLGGWLYRRQGVPHQVQAIEDVIRVHGGDGDDPLSITTYAVSSGLVERSLPGWREKNDQLVSLLRRLVTTPEASDGVDKAPTLREAEMAVFRIFGQWQGEQNKGGVTVTLDALDASNFSQTCRGIGERLENRPEQRAAYLEQAFKPIVKRSPVVKAYAEKLKDEAELLSGSTAKNASAFSQEVRQSIGSSPEDEELQRLQEELNRVLYEALQWFWQKTVEFTSYMLTATDETFDSVQPIPLQGVNVTLSETGTFQLARVVASAARTTGQVMLVGAAFRFFLGLALRLVPGNAESKAGRFRRAVREHLSGQPEPEAEREEEEAEVEDVRGGEEEEKKGVQEEGEEEVEGEQKEEHGSSVPPSKASQDATTLLLCVAMI